LSPIDTLIVAAYAGWEIQMIAITSEASPEIRRNNAAPFPRFARASTPKSVGGIMSRSRRAHKPKRD
jgi:hypothetical protein